MKTRKFTIGTRFSCVSFPRRNMKPLLGVLLKSEKSGGGFKSFRCFTFPKVYMAILLMIAFFS